MTRILRIASSLTIGLGIALLLAFPALPIAAGEVGTVIVLVEDQDGNALGGSCHSFDGPTYVGEVCDNAGSDADARVGWVKVADLAPGDWVISEVDVPDGYQIVGDPSLPAVVGPGATVTVVFTTPRPRGRSSRPCRTLTPRSSRENCPTSRSRRFRPRGSSRLPAAAASRRRSSLPPARAAAR